MDIVHVLYHIEAPTIFTPSKSHAFGHGCSIAALVLVHADALGYLPRVVVTKDRWIEAMPRVYVFAGWRDGSIA